MDSALSNALIIFGCLAIGLVSCVTWTRKKQRNLDELLTALRTLGSVGFNLRLDQALEDRLHTGVNRALSGLGKRFEIAERRGVEWEKAVDSIESIVAICDGEGRIIRANTRLADTLGLDIRQVLGQPLQGYLNHEGDCPIALTVSSKRPVVSLLPQSKLGLRVKLTTSVVERPGGELLVIAVMKEAPEEDAPVATTSNWHGLVHAIVGPAILADPTTSKVLTVNQAFTSMFGHDALAGIRLEQLLLVGSEENVATMRKAAFNKTSDAVTLDLKHADGTGIAAKVRGSLCRKGNGAPSSMLLTFETNRATTPPEQDHALLAAAMEGTHDGVIICDLEGAVIRVNATAAELYGRSADEMVGERLETFHIERLDPDSGGSDPWETVRYEGFWRDDLLRVQPEGACIPTRVTVSRVPRPGAEDAAVAVIHDLSAERQMQEEVLRSQKLATLGELSGSISHEISNPLTAMLEAARCVVEDLAVLEVDPELQRAAEDCLSASQQMQRILDEVRKFSHMGTGGRSLVTLDSVVTSAMVLAGPAVARHAAVQRPEHAGPEVWVHPGQLSQVVLNLVKNSAQAIGDTGERGTIRVEYDSDEDWGYLKVIDDGPGISDAVRARLFRDYVTTKRLGSGTGFGLRLSAKLIEENGGTITVDSKLGEGATFTIALSRHAVEGDSVDPAVMTSPTMEMAPPETWEGDVTMQDLDAEQVVTSLAEAAAAARDTLPFS